MPGTNAAQRVLTVLQKVQRYPDTGNVSETLKEILGPIPEGQDPFRTNARRLEAIQQQIDRTEFELKKANFPEHLFARHIASLRSAFSPHALNTSWAHVRQQVTAEAIVAFEWSAFALEDDASAYDDEAIRELIESATALANHDTLTRFPQAAREALKSAVEQLIDAARTSNIAGAGPIVKAYRDLVTELESEGSVVVDVASSDPAGQDFAKRVGDVLQKGRAAVSKTYESAAKHSDRIEKIIKLAERGWKAIEQLTAHFGQLPPPSGGAV